MRIDRAVSQLRRAAGLLALAAAIAPTVAGAQRRTSGRFELRDGDFDRGRERVQLELRDAEGLNESMTSFGIDPAQLQGLDRKRLASDGDSIRFRLVRDAGTIEFAGRAMDGRAHGRYSFVADPKFAAELSRRGYGRPWDDQQFQLALYDIGLEYVDELRAQSYDRPGIEQLVRMGQHGVTYGYLKSLDSLGLRVGTTLRLVTLRDHGVDGAFARDLAALGFKDLTTDDLRNARDHGVTADFVEGIQKAGFRDASIREMIRLRDHGVSASFARTARERHDVRTTGELVRLKDRGDY